MSDQHNEANFTNQEDNELDIRELLFRYIRYWYLFVIASIIAFTGAYVYNRYSARIYLVSSKILVQDSKKSPPGTEILKELDIFKDAGIVENEIEIIHSRPVISKAIENLNFSVSCFGVGDIKTSELYKENVPFKVVFDTLPPDYYDTPHKVYLDKSGVLKLTVLDKTYFVRFNEPFKIESAEITLLPGDGFDINQFLKSNDINRDYLIQFNSKRTLIEKFYEDFKVETVNKMATVIELSMKTSVPEKSKDFLNEVAKVYIQNGINQKSEMAANTLEFIKGRLKFVSTDLTEIESQAEQYKKSKGIANVSEEAKYFLEAVKEYDKELSAINIELTYINEIQKELAQKDFKIPSYIGPDNQSLSVLIVELNKLESLKIQYENTLKKDNPFNTILKEQILTSKNNITNNIEGLKQSLLLKQGVVKNKLSETEKSIRKVPTIERDLISIERQKSIKENLYLYLLEKQEESSIALASTVSDNDIIEPAYYSEKPIKPIKYLSYLLALLFGLSVPFIIIYIKEIINDTVISKSVIEKNTNVSIIGLVGQSIDLSSSIAVYSNAKSAISEEFRSIRTNLQFMGIGVKEKVLLITSSISGEGKTFISLNLALTFAISGKRTVVLEMDLRKPKLTKSLDSQNPVGISNYLSGLASLEEIVSHSPSNENLYTISSGPIPPNPAELLMSENLNLLVSDLKERFDIVIIDTPPIGLVTDSLIIAEFVDASLYIIRQSRTPKSYLSSIAELYKNKRMKNLSIVFNGIDRKLGNYGYGGYGYGYGYGYYIDEKQEKPSLMKRIIIFFRKS